MRMFLWIDKIIFKVIRAIEKLSMVIFKDKCTELNNISTTNLCIFIAVI